MWMWFDGSIATCGLPMNAYRKLASPSNDPTSTNYNLNYQVCYGFMSRHTGGCNMAACDGSVHFVNQEIDMTLYQALATIDGGEATVMSTSNPGTTLPAEFP
jgi:prepilin-type processing-associated H-X9-DG protein